MNQKNKNETDRYADIRNHPGPCQYTTLLDNDASLWVMLHDTENRIASGPATPARQGLEAAGIDTTRCWMHASSMSIHYDFRVGQLDVDGLDTDRRSSWQSIPIGRQ